jgi:hypothetical protein
MIQEKKQKIAKALSVVVTIAGLCVIAGWLFDIRFLKSISPAWISMKFDTAVAFALSGVTLYFLVRAMEGEYDKAQVVLSITSLIIILLMGILFFSAIFNIQTGAEELFIKDTPLAAKTITPGRPSMPTMVNFILIAAAGIMTLLNCGHLRLKLRIIGLIVGIIGALAMAGYILNIPLLCYYIADVNSAMACPTAALFVLTGIGLLCL